MKRSENNKPYNGLVSSVEVKTYNALIISYYNASDKLKQYNESLKEKVIKPLALSSNTENNKLVIKRIGTPLERALFAEKLAKKRSVATC